MMKNVIKIVKVYVPKDNDRLELLYIYNDSGLSLFIDRNGNVQTNVERYEIDSGTPIIRI